jgi:hypothetical protein
VTMQITPAAANALMPAVRGGQLRFDSNNNAILLPLGLP